MSQILMWTSVRYGSKEKNKTKKQERSTEFCAHDKQLFAPLEKCADYGEDCFVTSMINIICIAQQEIERLRIAEVKEK